MTTRTLLPALALIVAIGALVAGAVLWLGAEEAPLDPGTGGEAPVATAREGIDTPRATELNPREHAQVRFDLPWPFAEFSADISELLRPRRRDMQLKRDKIERDLGLTLSNQKVTVQLENVTPDDVIAELTRQFAPLGVNVYTREPPVDNDPHFEHFYITDGTIWDVIELMRVRTNDLVTFAVTPEGLCVGSPNACRDARIDAERWVDTQVGIGAPDADFDFLDGTYRPSFTDAHIGAVIHDVREQSGAEVVIGPEVWSLPIKLTWQAEPMPVLAALRQIAIKCGAALYAKDGRVFLLDR